MRSLPEAGGNAQRARQAGVFRVRLRIPQSLIDRHVEQVKTGVRGTGVDSEPNPPEWPHDLQKRFPGDPIDAGN